MNDLLVVVRKALGKSAGLPVSLPYALGLMAGSMFDAIARISGRTFPISRVRVEKFCATTVFRADRLRETGFSPPFDLSQGLLETIRTEFAPQRAGSGQRSMTTRSL
jgi:hypothetical protein